MVLRYYDKLNHRLVYIGKKANSEFWDAQWRTNDFEQAIKKPCNRFTIKYTTKYIKPGARLLEGGCGQGDKVYSLYKQVDDVYRISGYGISLLTSFFANHMNLYIFRK